MKKLWISCFIFLIPIIVYADNSWFSENTRIYSNSQLIIYTNIIELRNIAFSSYQDGDSFTLDILFFIRNDDEWQKIIRKTNYNIKKNPALYLVPGDLNQAKYLKKEIEFDFIHNTATVWKESFIDDDNFSIAWRSLREERDLITDKLLSKVARNLKNIFEVLLANPSYTF